VAADGAGGRHSPDDVLDYETARDALAEVVAKLEAGNLTLEESLALWERGESLAQVCRTRLDGARARVEAVLHGAAAAGENASDSTERGTSKGD
jgi:exodeoxyribonuclease VII small subunit